MKRKVIRQGHNTLTITLPKKWAENAHIKAGDEINVIEVGNKVMLTSEKTGSSATISVNVDGLGRLAIAKLIITCFEQGYDKVIINFTRQKTPKSPSYGEENITDVINFFVNRLVSFEVLSQTPKSITIGNLTEKLVNFESVTSRIFFLIEEYLGLLIAAFKSGDFSDLKNSENRHDNITKLVSLAIRMAYEDDRFSTVEVANYCAIFNILDKVTDFIRYAYRNAQKHKKVSKDTVELAEASLRYIELYRHLFNKFEHKSVNELDDLRWEVKNRFSELCKKGTEPEVNSSFDGLVEVLHGAVKARIALELAKGKE